MVKIGQGIKLIVSINVQKLFYKLFSFCDHYEASSTIVKYLLLGEKLLYSQLPYQSTHRVFLSTEYNKQFPPFVLHQKQK